MEFNKIRRQIKRELPDATLRRQIGYENERVTRMANRKERGTVKAYNDLIKLAKLAYTKSELKPIENALKKYKNTNPKQVW